MCFGWRHMMCSYLAVCIHERLLQTVPSPLPTPLSTCCIPHVFDSARRINSIVETPVTLGVAWASVADALSPHPSALRAVSRATVERSTRPALAWARLQRILATFRLPAFISVLFPSFNEILDLVLTFNPHYRRAPRSPSRVFFNCVWARSCVL